MGEGGLVGLGDLAVCPPICISLPRNGKVNDTRSAARCGGRCGPAAKRRQRPPQLILMSASSTRIYLSSSANFLEKKLRKTSLFFFSKFLKVLLLKFSAEKFANMNTVKTKSPFWAMLKLFWV